MFEKMSAIYIDPKFIEFLFIMLFWHWVRFFLFPHLNYTGLHGFVVEKLWVVSGVIFDVESESGIGIRISLSRQDFEIFEVMCSKNGGFRYF